MAGFFGGLAEGLGQGIQFASQQRARELQAQREAAYEQNLQSQEARRSAQTEAGLKLQDRQQHLDAYKELHNRINELGTQYAGGTPPPEALDEMKTLREQERALTGQLFPAATQSHTDARQTATDMASGNAKPKAEDVYNMLSQATGRPANELVSTDGKPTPTQQALNDFTQGMQNLQTDHGQQALRGLNTLYGDELHGYVGHALPGGGTVAAAEFAPPVPMQGGGMAPVIKLTSDNGSVRYVPLLSDQQSPEGNDLVHTVGLDKVLNHVNALQTVTHMVNADPTLKAVALSGDPDKARTALDARRVATAPAKQSMFMSPEELAAVNQARTQAGFGPIKTTTYVDKYGNEKVAPGGPGGLHEVAVNPRQAELDAAELQLKRRQAATVGLREVSGVDAEGKPVLGTLDVTRGQFTPASGIAPAPKGGLGGGGVAASNAATLTPEALDIAAQTYMQTGKLPPGFGRNVVAEGKVFDRVAELQRAQGNNAAAGVTEALANSARVGAVKDLQKRNTLLQGAERTALKNLDVLEGTVSKLDTTGSPILNKLTQALQSNVVQDPQLAAAKTALITFANEYARVVTGQTTGAAVTDSARKEQEQLLSLTDSPEAFKARIKVMRQDMANRTSAYDEELKSTLEHVTKKGGLAPDKTPEPAAAKEPSVEDLLKKYQ